MGLNELALSNTQYTASRGHASSGSRHDRGTLAGKEMDYIIRVSEAQV